MSGPNFCQYTEILCIVVYYNQETKTGLWCNVHFFPQILREIAWKPVLQRNSYTNVQRNRYKNVHRSSVCSSKNWNHSMSTERKIEKLIIVYSNRQYSKENECMQIRTHTMNKMLSKEKRITGEIYTRWRFSENSEPCKTKWFRLLKYARVYGKT